MDKKKAKLAEKDKALMYLELMIDNQSWCRHHEQQRSSVCSLIFILAGAALWMIELYVKDEDAVLALGIFIIIIGIFGICFVYKHYERFISHFSIFKILLREIDEKTDLEIRELIRESHETRKKDFRPYPIFHRTRLHLYWAFLMFIVVLTGIYIVIDSF